MNTEKDCRARDCDTLWPNQTRNGKQYFNDEHKENHPRNYLNESCQCLNKITRIIFEMFFWIINITTKRIKNAILKINGMTNNTYKDENIAVVNLIKGPIKLPKESNKS